MRLDLYHAKTNPNPAIPQLIESFGKYGMLNNGY
jgi:hypothetical protein